jgi:hypothetical protein
VWFASGAVQDPAGATAAYQQARRLNPRLSPTGAIQPFDPAQFPKVSC